MAMACPSPLLAPVTKAFCPTSTRCMGAGGISSGGVYPFSGLTGHPSIEALPSGHRLRCNRIAFRFKVTLEVLKVRRGKVQIERSLARELLIEHELTGMLRVNMEFVDNHSWFLAAGRNQRMQFASQLLFVARGRLNVSVDDDRCFCH